MEYPLYRERAAATFFPQGKVKQLDGALLFYESVFRWEWIATKMNLFSFLAYAQQIDERRIAEYTDFCMKYVSKHRRGLPRGLQNGDAVQCVLASEHVDGGAMSYARRRPKKHFAAFENPVVVDLSDQRAYFYQGDMIWGMLYSRFMNEYMYNHFIVPLTK